MDEKREEGPQPYSDSWDSYAEQSLARGERWPGDDWGDERLWSAWFERLFRPCGVERWARAVEIGPGTGKYTGRVLEAGCQEVLACDVSTRFLELCRERMKSLEQAGRLHLRQIAETEPYSIQEVVGQLDWDRKVDAIFSIDTMVHLSFTHVVCYLLAGSDVLRPGGHFLFSFADGTTEAGRRKMIQDVERTVRDAGHPRTGCFHWISPELLRTTATSLGYQVELCEPDPFHGRDGHFIGRLTDPEKATQLRNPPP